MLSRVEKRIARALLVLSIERFAWVIPIFFRQLAGGYFSFCHHNVKINYYSHGATYIVSSFSAFISMAEQNTFLSTLNISIKNPAAVPIM